MSEDVMNVEGEAMSKTVDYSLKDCLAKGQDELISQHKITGCIIKRFEELGEEVNAYTNGDVNIFITHKHTSIPVVVIRGTFMGEEAIATIDNGNVKFINQYEGDENHHIHNEERSHLVIEHFASSVRLAKLINKHWKGE